MPGGLFFDNTHTLWAVVAGIGTMTKSRFQPNLDFGQISMKKTQTLHEMDAQGLFFGDSEFGNVSFSRRIGRKP